MHRILQWPSNVWYTGLILLNEVLIRNNLLLMINK